MKRRLFQQSAMAVVCSGTLSSAWAQRIPVQPVPGRDFQLVEPAAPVDAPAGKIEVVEFFWYSCPQCNAFEPLLQAWLQQLPKDVVFRRVPVAFRDDFVPQQRLYYALDALDLVGKLHAKVFQAIHAQGQRLATLEQIAPWVSGQGVAQERFVQAYNSLGVSSKARRATQLQDAYRVEGVPAMGVAGRFLTDGAMVPDYQTGADGKKVASMRRALQVVDALIQQARRG
ncbi:MAG: thiol:disulfide interchange protein DsbA/DsbL [Rhodoferax sp.]